MARGSMTAAGRFTGHAPAHAASALASASASGSSRDSGTAAAKALRRVRFPRSSVVCLYPSAHPLVDFHLDSIAQLELRLQPQRRQEGHPLQHILRLG